MRALIISAALAAATLTGCAGLSERDQRIGAGAVIGGVVGNAIGGSTAATVGGAVVGGLIGAEVNRNRTDRRYEDARRRYDECLRYNSRRFCDDQRY